MRFCIHYTRSPGTERVLLCSCVSTACSKSHKVPHSGPHIIMTVLKSWISELQSDMLNYAQAPLQPLKPAMSSNSDPMALSILAKCRSIRQQFDTCLTIIRRHLKCSRASSRNIQQRHSNTICRLRGTGCSGSRDCEEVGTLRNRSPPFIVLATIHMVFHVQEISFRAS